MGGASDWRGNVEKEQHLQTSVGGMLFHDELEFLVWLSEDWSRSEAALEFQKC